MADLAGISFDYIVRLEQGRATSPSGQVVEALSRALRLTKAEHDHLYDLAGLRAPTNHGISYDISPGVRRLLTRLGEIPVAVFAADWQLLWWSRSWAAVVGDPMRIPVVDRNFATSRFPSTPGSPHLGAWATRSTDRDASDRAIVADLRRASARYPDDRGLTELLRRTIRGNARFERLWRDGAVGAHAEDRKTIEHPGVGDITVDCDVLSAGDTDLKIVALTASPGSEDARRIDSACFLADFGDSREEPIRERVSTPDRSARNVPV